MNPCPHELHEPRIPDAAEAAACEEEGAADEVEGVGADRSGILIPPL